MGAARTLGSIAAAVCLVGAAGSLTWVDRAVPATPAPTATPATVVVDAAASRVVCLGQLKLSADEGGEVIYDPAFDPAPTSVWAVTTGYVFSPAGGRAWNPGQEGTVELAPGGAVLSGEPGPSPLVLAATQGDDSLTGGGVLIDVEGGDLRGLAGASCLAPRAESFLVGGGTEVGASSRLTLVNPGDTTVTVDLALWGAAGPVEAVGATGLVLPPGSQRVIPVEGLVGGERRLAVRVTASGGEIVAYLQHSRLDGITPAGVDVVVPGTEPRTTTVLPGIVAQATTLDSTDPTTLRLLAPGETDAAVSVTLLGADGEADLPATQDLVLPAGEVTDVQLLGLPEGVYTAIVESDQPVIVSALSTTFGETAEAPREFAWSAAAPAPSAGYLAVFPQTAAVAIGGAAGVPVTFTPVLADGSLGQPVQVTSPEGATRLFTPAELGAGEGVVGLRYSLDAGGRLGIAAVHRSEDGTKLSVSTPTDSVAVDRAALVDALVP
jgi:hypothetical protein